MTSSQQLLFPFTLELSPVEAQVLENSLPGLSQIGFVIRPFGGRTFVVEAVPAMSHSSIDAEKVKDLLAEIYEMGISLGGTISGEHGLGFAKKGYLAMAADKNKVDLMKRIKRAFDPNNILNPGKVLDME